MNNLYTLRKNFTIIGLTGRVGAGCSEIAAELRKPKIKDFLSDFKWKAESNIPEEIKDKICADYLSSKNNWTPFKVIQYKDVLLLHLLFESIVDNRKSIDKAIAFINNVIGQNGINTDYGENFSNRFDEGEDEKCFIKLNQHLKKNRKWFDTLSAIPTDDIIICLKDKDKQADFYKFYFDYFEKFCVTTLKILDDYDVIKRTRLCHDIANNLRLHGTVRNEESKIETLNIYRVAETINRLIKCYSTKHSTTKIVIDSLKNSIELLYFKEKFAGFYMLAVNMNFEERKDKVANVISKVLGVKGAKLENIVDGIMVLDESEYKGKEVKKGIFSSPDIENCIQKSDYHIFYSSKYFGIKESKSKTAKTVDSKYNYLSLKKQLVRFISLIQQPGIVTPTGLERTMQVAYNAKYNSGCISRQVGAAITDKHFSIKAIGWNDVPKNQIPCNLRSATDLVSGKNKDHFSDFEKGINIDSSTEYSDKKTFSQKLKTTLSSANIKELNGRNCSFCFKTCHNNFEKKENQVHTRSLHAEENAMLQIVKYGGQGIHEGNLFTTASPCELCSKKAFQLGIKNIYYIDPYPGISSSHILINGTSPEQNPKLLMFQGGVGRAYHKLYEPFMSYKDEIKILTGFNPVIEEDDDM